MASKITDLRYFFDISYHGKNYHGWQIQPDDCSVQQQLQDTLSTYFRSTLKITGAGRTDTGVHARQLFFHVDIDSAFPLDETRFKLNRFLPTDISIQKILPVHPEAHARFDAIARTYEYWISLRKDPFLNGLAWEVHRIPDIDVMNIAAKQLCSHSDFECFSRSKTDVTNFNCTITEALWERDGDTLIFTITANRFLRNMVRAIVGTLMDVGYNKCSLEEFKRILASKDRSMAGASAPAHGLYLTAVTYPKNLFLNSQAES